MAENKFYTKWWFWVIIGVVIIGLIGSLFSNSSTDSANQNINQDTSQDIESSLTNPSSIGESLTTTFGFGQLITAEYTVLEIIRGENAWKMIKSANQFNAQPDEGKEYLLAKIKFHLIETSDEKSYMIPFTIFDVFSKDGMSYDYQSVVLPTPGLLSKELYPGATYEGWIAYQIPIEETEPILRVSYLDEGEIFFKLYPPNSTSFITQDISQEKGLNEIVNAGDLSFKLINVTFSKWEEDLSLTTEIDNDIPAKSYSMFWVFEVTNNGENIKYVSDCGTLLFEDSSQYSPIGSCKEYSVVPGATVKISSSQFVFSDAFIMPGTKPWEEVPGSKITYFSQQTGGLIKYSIDKSEIDIW